MANIPMERVFKVASVERCSAPVKGKGGAGRWHRYIVKNELTTIEGYASGSKKEVTDHAARYVEQLNAKNDPAKKVGPRRTTKRVQRQPAVAK